MNNKLHIAVLGSDSDHCSENAKKLAKEVGTEIAKAGAILVTGGGEGVMKYASLGAQERGGMVIGILPGADKRKANEYCNIIIPTEIGFARGQVIANTADAAIVIEGGFGTRNEVGETYWRLIPTIALAQSGGTAQEIANTYLDKRKLIKTYSGETPSIAVEQALRLGQNRLDLQTRLQEVNLDLSLYRTVPSKFIRINPRNPIDITELERKLSKDYDVKAEFKPAGFRGIRGIYESSNSNIGGTINGRKNELFMKHYFIQDLASVVAVSALEMFRDAPPYSYLELGAAPGFKTILVHDKLEGKVNITVVDNHPRRFEQMTRFFQDYGVPATAHLKDGTTFCRGKYEKVLVDAPCSGEGMIVKFDSELQQDVGGINKVLEYSKEDIAKFAEVQLKLLQNGFNCIENGSTVRLVYVTCALNKEENDAVVERFLEKNPSAGLMDIDLETIEMYHGNPYTEFEYTKVGVRIRPGKTKGLYFTKICQKERSR